MSVPAELSMGGPPSRSEVWLWAIAAMLVLTAHAALAYILNDVTFRSEPPDATKAAVIELAPLPVSMPDAVQSETLPQEEPVDSVQPVEEQNKALEPEKALQPDDAVETVQADPDQPAQPDNVEETPPEPAPQPEVPADKATTESEPERPEPIEPRTVEPEAVNPDVVPEPKPEIVQPRPKAEPQRTAENLRKKPVRRKARTARPARQADQAATPTVPRTVGRSSAASAASQKSAASKAPDVDAARWHSAVRAAIARSVGRMRGLRGTLNISFVVANSGAVTSARVVRSSGDGAVDRAALSAVRSARVPPPPPGIGGSSHVFAIPVTFK